MLQWSLQLILSKISTGAARLCPGLNMILSRPLHSWEKPAVDHLKCNIWLSPFLCWKLLWCWHMCFRDNKGQFVLASTAWIPSICTVAECEATALLLSLRLAASQGFVHVTFESDCQTVLNAMHNPCTYENELDFVLSWCRTLISSKTKLQPNFYMESS